MFRAVATALTAQNATETTKTQIEQTLVPQGVSKLVAIGVQISSAGITTLEDLTGILQLESDDMSPWGGTQTFCFGGVNTGVTSGVSAMTLQLIPCNIPVSPGSHITASTTFNKALTINPSIRVQYLFE